MPTTDDGQGIAPLQQKDKHMGNSRYGGGTNMNDKDYSRIGGHMSAGHLDSLKDIYGQARREQLYNPVVEDAGALSMNSPLNDYKVTADGVAPTEADTHPGHHGDGPMKMKQDALYQTTDPKATESSEGDMYSKSQAYNEDFKNGIGAGMNSLALNSQERHDEYNRRGWAHDDSSELRTGTMTEDAIMYDEYPGPNAPGVDVNNEVLGGFAKKKLEIGNKGGNFLPTSEDDPRYNDLKK